MRTDRERLLDIAEAIQRIESYANRGRAEFEASELIQTWIIHHLQIIGEAVRALSTETTEHSEVEWKKNIGMRHILIHNYFDIDKDIVWAVIDNDLPLLKEKVTELLARPPG